MDNVRIKQQNRKSLAMRVLLSGEIVVFIPNWIKPNSREVKKFIKTGLEKLSPQIPANQPQQYHDADSIRAMVDVWSEQVGVYPKRVQMRTMYRKWGSCSTKGSITLNTALYWLPDHLVEYIVVHELVHMLVFDHSPAFWSKLAQYLPDYAERERELDTFRL